MSKREAATQPDHERLANAFLSGRSPSTIKCYKACLKHFCRWADLPDADAAAELILSMEPGPANELILKYRTDMVEAELSASTINLRLAAIRSMVKLGRTLGMIVWAIEVPNVKTESYRDTAGPGTDGVRDMLALAGDQKRPAKAARDCAIIRLLFDTALRRGEVLGLRLCDVDLGNSRVSILGKGRADREWITLPRPTREALALWLDYRPGVLTDAVFTTFDRAARNDGSLTGDGAYQLIRSLSTQAGCTTRPCGLRHSAITQSLDSGNDIRSVQRFSRHKSVDTVCKYDDNRENLGAKIAAGVASAL